MLDVNQGAPAPNIFDLIEYPEQQGYLKPSKDPDSLSIETLAQWLEEIRNQPGWRKAADREDQYYEGNQLDADTLELYAERGQAPIVDNQIQPAINTILGMQAKNRADPIVSEHPGMSNTDVAEALSVKLKEAHEEVMAHRAKSDAYANCIKTGLGWLEVSRTSNPFCAPYRYKSINRREIWWDWAAKEPYLSDARYLVRKKWVDADILKSMFPNEKKFIDSAVGGRASWDQLIDDATGFQEYMRNFETSSELILKNFDEYEWLNTTRKRLCLYEVWYRQYCRGKTFKLPNNRVIEFDKKNPKHVAAEKAGIINVVDAMYDKVRVSFWVGPKMVSDDPTPYRHRLFPYVPMFGFKEQESGIPFGYIRSMLSPQDEINARKMKMIHLLNTRRVTATEGAVADHNAAAEEVARSDAYVIVSNDPRESFNVDDNKQLPEQQYRAMIEAKESLQTAVGIHNASLGRASGATSGLAINSLIEQDSITMAEINDNANMAFNKADELLLHLIIQDLSDEHDERVIVKDDFGREREIVLNQHINDPETGEERILNDVNKINPKVVMSDTPNTPTFRNQQLNQLSDVITHLPPNAQAALTPFLIDATDLPNRKQMVEVLRSTLGLGYPDDEVDAEKEALKQQVAELTQALEAKHPQELLQAQVGKILAEIEKIRADTINTSVGSTFSAMQSAGAAVENPLIVPVADQILASSGYEDQDGEPIQVDEQLDVDQMPGETPNTNPMTPDLPNQMAMEQPGPDQVGMESANVGVNEGIRTPDMGD